MSNENWFVATFDDVVEESSESGGIALADAERFVVARFVRAVHDKRVPKPKPPSVEEIGHQLFRKFIPPQRRRRSEHLSDDLGYILDALKDPENGASIDPLLKFAIPLGTSDGRDRTLGLWTADDYAKSAITRYRNAAEVTAAAKEYDENAQLIIEKLRETSARFTRDLFTDD